MLAARQNLILDKIRVFLNWYYSKGGSCAKTPVICAKVVAFEVDVR